MSTKPIVTISLPRVLKAVHEAEAESQSISSSALFENDLKAEIEKVQSSENTESPKE